MDISSIIHSKTKDFIDDLVKLFGSGKFKLSLILGAGISKNPPSNLPLAAEIRHLVLAKLFANQTIDKDALSKLEKAYPFEAFVQILAENSNFIDYLLKIFKLGEPNKNHTLIAKLVKKGYVSEILTTNFDLNLERAFENEGLAFKKDFKVVSFEEGSTEISSESINVQILIKIHGSVDNKESIRTTLKQISAKRLLESRKKLIRQFFERAQVILVLGYSFSDEFDINPTLNELRTKSKIFWIKHSKDISQPKLVQNLLYPLENLNGKLVAYNTDEFIDQVWNVLIKDELTFKTKPKNEWSSHVEHWNQSLSAGQRFFIIGRSLDSVREPHEAERFFRKSLEVTRKTGDERRLSYILNELSIICWQKGNFTEAEGFCQESLKLKEKLRDQTRLSESYYNLGNISQLRGDYAKAQSYYEEGLRIDRNIKNNSGISHALSNLAALEQLRGNYDKAERMHNESLDLKESLGDLAGMAYTLYHLAVIAQDKSNYEKAEQLYWQSLKIRKKIKEDRGISEILHNLATINQYRGNLDRAERMHEKGLEIDNRLGNVSNIQQTLNNLGGIQILRGNYDKAIELFEKSLELAVKLGDQVGKSSAFHNLAIIQKHKGNYAKAEILHGKGLEIDEKREDKPAIAGTLFELATIQQLKENYIEAETLYKRAMTIIKELGDKRGIGLIYRQLGTLCLSFGKIDSAKFYFESARAIFVEIKDKHHQDLLEKDLAGMRNNR